MRNLLLTLTILSFSTQLLATGHIASSSTTDDIFSDDLENLLIEKRKELLGIQHLFSCVEQNYKHWLN